MQPDVDEPSAPRVFLSYTHDSPEHVERVLGLANRLRGEGVDANLDQSRRRRRRVGCAGWRTRSRRPTLSSWSVPRPTCGVSEHRKSWTVG
ncbi:MAG: hypothetical protein GY719_40825 [bacterium]|nr:hypothetical protein [bacterium]